MTDEGSSADDEKVRLLRELIPATAAGIYLDTAYRGPMSAEVAAAMRDADDWELRVGRAAEGREEDFAQKRDEARAVIAALIGADPTDVSLTSTSPDVRFEHLVDPVTGELRAAHSRAVDATLAAGAVPLDVATLDADLLFIPGDRWLLGPEGAGAVWVRQGTSGTEPAIHDTSLGRTQILGLARSVGWLEMYVGLDWLYERGNRLGHRLHDALTATTGVEVITPASAMATIVVFKIAPWPATQAVEELRSRVFAIIGTTPGDQAIRASVAWFNTEEELDRFAAAVAELARYTPATLPRRPRLVVQ